MVHTASSVQRHQRQQHVALDTLWSRAICQHADEDSGSLDYKGQLFFFYIQITFLLYNVDTPDVQCSNSVLTIRERLDIRFCGKRQPWSQVVPYESAVLILQRIDIIKKMELSFTYCIFDQLELREKIMTTRINVEELPDKRNQQLSNVALNKHNFAVIWYLYAPIGKVLAIALSRLHTFDQMSIY